MLIAVEVGTKSKWAISPELYFQMAPVGQTTTPSKHIFALFENFARKVSLQKKGKYANIKLPFLLVIIRNNLKTRTFLKSPISFLFTSKGRKIWIIEVRIS